MRSLLLLSGLVIAGGVLRAQPDERDRVSRLRRSLSPKKQAPVEERLAAVQSMRGLDSLQAARALVRAYGWIDARVAELELRRLELLRRLYAIRFDAKEKVKAAGRARTQMLKKLRQETNSTRTAVDEHRSVRRAVEARLRELESAKALTWLARSVVAGKRAPVGLRVAAARALATTPEPGHDLLLDILGKPKKPTPAGPTAAALAGAVAAGRETAFVARATELLRHDAAVGREGAARALAASCDPRAILPLVDLLAASSGQGRNRVVALLEALTRQKHGASVGAWRGWYADNEDDLLAGRIELGPEPPAKGKRKKRQRRRGEAREPGPTYMGIPMDGDAIVFVLDASMSMKAKVDFAIPGVTKADGGKATRLDACKAELIRALNRLTPRVRFNVLYLHESVGSFRESLVQATADNVALARTFVRKIEPRFATNIHDALQAAFVFLDPERSRRPLGDGVDTIFLLTDGRPYHPKGGGPDSWPKILAACDDWDPLRRVTIHCIGVGKAIAKRPMRQLAKAHGGEARFY